MERLDAIFSPKSVAVLGASSTPGKVGHDIFANILRGEYTGTLYPVNPKARSILCVRCYESITEIPDPVDMAMIILPPKLALQAVRDCVEKGVKGIVIVSAGFKEVGGEGAQIETEIADVCRRADIPLVGPNCLGVINPHPDVRLNASFSTHLPEYGNISFISQSGALCTAVLDFAMSRGYGFSKFISIGNKADVDEFDLLQYYHKDPETRVMMVYMEELRMRENFVDKLKHITSDHRPTPILVIKSGKTASGAKAASSHTGSLAGSEAVYNAIFDEAGIMRVDTVDELFDYAGVFSANRLPAGNRTAIITNAGGPGIIATDMTEVSGLKLAQFSDETDAALRQHLPPTANFSNPVDVIGDAPSKRYEHALDAVIKDDGVDCVLMILTPQSMTDAIGTARAIVKTYKNTDKPIICCFMGVVDVSAGVQYLQEHHVPVYAFPENAARAMGMLYEATRWLTRTILPQYDLTFDRDRARKIVDECLKSGKTVLGEHDGARLLQCYGFPTLPAEVVGSAREAGQEAEKMGYPVVMKVVSPQILHKMDAKAVVLNIETSQEAQQAYTDIVNNAKDYNPDAQIQGVMVTKMAPKGEEVILGVNRHPGFGHLLMFGFGGIYVELFKNVSFRMAPIGRNNARRMIRSVRGYQILTGYRGKPRADIETIEKLLVGLSSLVTDCPQVKELDINPLLVHEESKGATVADIIITLEEE
ncbi:MAG: acetate--CoA ligase family protein [Desulfosalsimonas sp.]|uniref:acetate--CoA ligase alpha subunit n=1 Tax=Desulfosalsimonas sp. TaxID=3073848 RepID=UPI0039704678